MPPFFSFAAHENEATPATPGQEMGGGASEDRPTRRQHRASSLMRGLGNFWRKQHAETEPFPTIEDAPGSQTDLNGLRRLPSLPENLAQRRAVPSLPRPQTFRRQQSEQREKLLTVPDKDGRRTLSVDRRRGLSESTPRAAWSPRTEASPRVSLPEFQRTNGQSQESRLDTDGIHDILADKHMPELPSLEITDSPEDIRDGDEDVEDNMADQGSIQEECDQCWILNLSMNFRDKSHREKFFVTYAQTPARWRRLTISLDYRNAPKDSLEADLSTLHYQRDKSFRIYEAIRESLPDIQYYNTVTNLKLETTPEDGQLHVHVREDANEIVRYPPMPLFDHINCARYTESELKFVSHLSGFVYKVQVCDSIVIKKEIPGPDTVDEFLYEVNALDSLLESRHVVRLEGLVTNEDGSAVKGLLISYASQGALVDMLYDFRNTPEMPWERREKWARQIVSGLSDIHEAGFVQGDFTLSNVVIDDDDDAQIIDINRRGCPVGWEPPELSRLIDSGQRIGMCIGVKTDLFQLGMVLWALAEEVDEPERVERPLPRVVDTIPNYFRDLVDVCLSSRPQNRAPAARLLLRFPSATRTSRSPSSRSRSRMYVSSPTSSTSTSTTPPSSARRHNKEYIDPAMAITLADVGDRKHHAGHAHHRRGGRRDTDAFTSGQVTYVDPSTTTAAALPVTPEKPERPAKHDCADEAEEKASRDSWERVERWDLGREAAAAGAAVGPEGVWEPRGRSPGASSLRRGSSFVPGSDGHGSLGGTVSPCSPVGRCRSRAGSAGSDGGVRVGGGQWRKGDSEPQEKGPAIGGAEEEGELSVPRFSDEQAGADMIPDHTKADDPGVTNVAASGRQTEANADVQEADPQEGPETSPDHLCHSEQLNGAQDESAREARKISVGDKNMASHLEVQQDTIRPSNNHTPSSATEAPQEKFARSQVPLDLNDKSPVKQTDFETTATEPENQAHPGDSAAGPQQEQRDATLSHPNETSTGHPTSTPQEEPAQPHTSTVSETPPAQQNVAPVAEAPASHSKSCVESSALVPEKPQLLPARTPDHSAASAQPLTPANGGADADTTPPLNNPDPSNHSAPTPRTADSPPAPYPPIAPSAENLTPAPAPAPAPAPTNASPKPKTPAPVEQLDEKAAWALDAEAQAQSQARVVEVGQAGGR